MSDEDSWGQEKIEQHINISNRSSRGQPVAQETQKDPHNESIWDNSKTQIKENEEDKDDIFPPRGAPVNTSLLTDVVRKNIQNEQLKPDKKNTSWMGEENDEKKEQVAPRRGNREHRGRQNRGEAGQKQKHKPYGERNERERNRNDGERNERNKNDRNRDNWDREGRHGYDNKRYDNFRKKSTYEIGEGEKQWNIEDNRDNNRGRGRGRGRGYNNYNNYNNSSYNRSNNSNYREKNNERENNREGNRNRQYQVQSKNHQSELKSTNTLGIIPSGRKCWPESSLFILGCRLCVTYRPMSDFRCKLLVVPYSTIKMQYFPGNILNKSSVDYKRKIINKGEEIAKPGNVYLQKAVDLEPFEGLAFLKVDPDDAEESMRKGTKEVLKLVQKVKGGPQISSIIFPIGSQLGSPEAVLSPLLALLQNCEVVKQVYITSNQPECFIRAMNEFTRQMGKLIDDNQILYD